MNFENYPIKVKCLHIPNVQAFYIDWVVFKGKKKCCIYFYIDWAVLKYCPINVKCLRIYINGLQIMRNLKQGWLQKNSAA